MDRQVSFGSGDDAFSEDFAEELATEFEFAQQGDHPAPANLPIKLIVQIPCFNEEETLPRVLADIPREIDGVDCIEVQVIDDGSSDRTVEVAQANGVQHIVRNKSNKGLARSFQAGINNAVSQGADIIVNTDGDHQYPGRHIADLVRPIIEGRADVVIGDRNPSENPEFSALKRSLQKVGSAVVENLSGIEVGDAVSGFRAYSRDAALKINVMTSFSYTTETLIHAGRSGLTVEFVPIKTNSATRPSRLFKSMQSFLRRQVVSILRSYFMYRSLSAFMTLGLVMAAIGLIPILRFVYFFAIGQGDGNIQSLVIGSMLAGLGYITFVIAFLSDSIATNRRISEECLERLRRMEAQSGKHVSNGENR
ncbi:MAG: glycosyltransferase family 2 protein [Novosphingobium sp.]|nr:glycosyltransferase family 2 protein [Novosphingobium sp.]